MTKANEGKVTYLKQDKNDNFLCYFVALGSFIKSCMCIMLMIAVDGAHPNGSYRESMFVVTCLDGNNQLYLLAIRVINSENNDT